MIAQGIHIEGELMFWRSNGRLLLIIEFLYITLNEISRGFSIIYLLLKFRIYDINKFIFFYSDEKFPKSFSIAFNKSPDGSPPPFGDITVQNKL